MFCARDIQLQKRGGLACRWKFSKMVNGVSTEIFFLIGRFGCRFFSAIH
jgi:hypothetical protein